jgi:hypothetical protein
MSMLASLEEELVGKYPEKGERIRQIAGYLAGKLHSLRVYTLNDYLFNIYLASREFQEFTRLMPKPEEVDEVLGLESED